MKGSHILMAIGLAGVLGIGAWYVYLQKAPLPAASGDSSMTNRRGLELPTGKSKEAAAPKPAEKPAEAPKPTEAPKPAEGAAPTETPKPAEGAAPTEAPEPAGDAPTPTAQ